MKLHIENISITISSPPPVGMIAGIALASAAKGDLPAIGEKWPGTEATYAGVSLSMTGDSLVHLLLWDDAVSAISCGYDMAVKHAEEVSPDMGSHLPTRAQSIALFERLADRFDQDSWHWTLTKTLSGKAAFIQSFVTGAQYDSLSAECRVRAVSEIPLQSFDHLVLQPCFTPTCRSTRRVTTF